MCAPRTVYQLVHEGNHIFLIYFTVVVLLHTNIVADKLARHNWRGGGGGGGGGGFNKITRYILCVCVSPLN